jgi:hypothetical protein
MSQIPLLAVGESLTVAVAVGVDYCWLWVSQTLLQVIVESLTVVGVLGESGPVAGYVGDCDFCCR